jgi:hypothetical protein
MKRKLSFSNLFRILMAVIFLAGIQQFVVAQSYNLTHSYTFDDGSADDTVSVGAVNGTVTGSYITIADGMATVSGATTPTDGYIEFDGTALALNTYSAITLEFKIKAGDLENVNKWTMLAYFGSSTAGQNCLWMQPARQPNDESKFNAHDGTTEIWAYKVDAELDDGLYHHLVGILTTTKLLYYLDGELVAEANSGPNFVSAVGTDIAYLFKGAWPDPNYNGAIDEFNIYNDSLEAADIAAMAAAYLDSKDTRLSDITLSTGSLLPDFDMSTRTYVALVDEGTTDITVTATANNAGATVTGGGAVVLGELPDTVEIEVESADATASATYTVYVMADVECFDPAEPELTSLTTDPECTDLTKWGGWGSRSIYYGPEAYCGPSCARLVAPGGGCDAALDIADYTWEPYTKYRLVAMVKTVGGSIGFLAKGTANIFGYAINTGGEWELVDTSFVTGATPGTGFFSFNTCDFESNCTETYIDNYEFYAVPFDIGIIQKTGKTFDANAADYLHDPIVQMLSMNDKFRVTVEEVAGDATVDLSGYDLVIAQETFGSGDAIWQPGNSLGLAGFTQPFIYNKVYAMKDGRAFTGGATGSGGEEPNTFYMHVDASLQDTALFNGITFDGDSVQIFKTGATDEGAAGEKGLQFATDVVISATGTLMGSGVNDPVNATVCLNDISDGETIGAETLQARMFAFAMNYGAIVKDGGDNITEAGLTLWRNAVLLGLGLPVPTEPVDKTTEIVINVPDATIAFNSDSASYQITLPSGTTSAALTVDVIRGKDPQIPVIEGLTDGQDDVYELVVHAPIGLDSTVYKVYVHVQSAMEILYVGADNDGVLDDARDFDKKPVQMLKDAGYSVTHMNKNAINTMDFDYSPFAAMVIAPGVSSSNTVKYAQMDYPVPCVTMQPDGPRNDKWGWVNKADATEMYVTKVYDSINVQLVITDTTHFITGDYLTNDTVIWTFGGPATPDWSGREVKTYDLTDSIPEAMALGKIPADGNTLYSLWAVPAGVSVRSINEAGDGYERRPLANNIVYLGLFSDGLLDAGDDLGPLLDQCLTWVYEAGAAPEAEITASAGALGYNSDAGSYEINLPSGSTSVDLTVTLIHGKDPKVPVIDGLTDGQDAVYDVVVYATVGLDSTVYKVYVHVQSDEEILYVGADSDGVLADAKNFDKKPVQMLRDAGLSVTYEDKNAINNLTFDYSPYAAMVIASGVSSSNTVEFAQMDYPVPCVSLQPDGPRSDKWGWVNKSDASEMYVTKVYDATTAQIVVTDTTHYITMPYNVNEVITWTLGTADSADWSGREVKTYDLTDSIPEAKGLAKIPADGNTLTSLWAVPAGVSVRSINAAGNGYERRPLANNIVYLGLFSDGLLYAGDDLAPLLLRSLAWVRDLGIDATLSDLQVDAATIPGFKSDLLDYTIYLHDTVTIVPTVTATATDANAEVVITDVAALPGITKVEVTAEDGLTVLTYKVGFTFAGLGTDATLSDLLVDATTVTGFAADKYTYDVELPIGTTTVPAVTATPTDANASADITDATTLPGSTTVLVTAENGVVQLTYTINFTVAPNNDASLSDLLVDATTVTGFATGTYIYNIDLPAGTTSVNVTATPTDANADVAGEGAVDVSTGSGTATITVTAEDGTTTQDYVINFTVLIGVESTTAAKINIFPNPVSHELTVTNVENATISIYELNGLLLRTINNTDRNAQIDVSGLGAGIYLIKVQTSDYITIARFIKN